MRSLFLLLFLAACTRPLTQSEASFSAQFTGVEAAQTARIGQAIYAPPPRDIPVRPRTTCQSRIWPEREGPTMRVATLAAVLFDNIYVREGIYEPNMLPDYPQEIYLPDAMLLGHEMVHVWQWQNRETTGYHPLLAALEHRGGRDPYLIDPETTADFLSFGYEQQGAIMEEYICCLALAPTSDRTQRLYTMLDVHFDLPRPGDRLAQSVRLPFPELSTAGICDP